jgi:hypothetical protein
MVPKPGASCHGHPIGKSIGKSMGNPLGNPWEIHWEIKIQRTHPWEFEDGISRFWHFLMLRLVGASTPFLILEAGRALFFC